MTWIFGLIPFSNLTSNGHIKLGHDCSLRRRLSCTDIERLNLRCVVRKVIHILPEGIPLSSRAAIL